MHRRFDQPCSRSKRQVHEREPLLRDLPARSSREIFADGAQRTDGRLKAVPNALSRSPGCCRPKSAISARSTSFVPSKIR